MSESLLPVADGSAVRRAAVGEVRADRRTIALVLALNALAAAAGLVGPWLLGTIVNTVSATPGPAVLGTVDRLALIIVGCTLLQTVLARYALYAASRFGERAAARIRERFLDRVLALPAATVEQAVAGDLVTRGTSDVTMIASSLVGVIPEVFIALIQLVFIVGAVLFLAPLLGVCSLACSAGVALVLRWYLRGARTAYPAQARAGAGTAETLGSTVAGARTVEALGLREQRMRAAQAAIATARRTGLHTLWLRSVLFPSIDVLISLPVVAVLLIGGALYFHGGVGLGVVVSCAVYMRQLTNPVDAILQWVEQIQQSTASYARVEGLATAPRAVRYTDAEPADERITVSEVCYGYGDGPDVLSGVDLEITAGERLAIVGPSGAGKSTLGRLLAGLERPRRGTVLVGGVPVADLAPDRLRRHVVLVTQEHHVFQDSLRDNLLLARPDATDADLRAALAAVDAAWAADLPDGLDTRFGDGGGPRGGVRLDGSQAQQLALARVVLADPHTVILDEATALLDPRTARHTERALAAVLKGRTVIAIAHRLQTAHDADRVAVMSAGTVTELGTHVDLVAAGGEYARLWQAWHGPDQVPGGTP